MRLTREYLVACLENPKTKEAFQQAVDIIGNAFGMKVGRDIHMTVQCFFRDSNATFVFGTDKSMEPIIGEACRQADEDCEYIGIGEGKMAS